VSRTPASPGCHAGRQARVPKNLEDRLGSNGIRLLGDSVDLNRGACRHRREVHRGLGRGNGVNLDKPPLRQLAQLGGRASQPPPRSHSKAVEHHYENRFASVEVSLDLVEGRNLAHTRWPQAQNGAYRRCEEPGIRQRIDLAGQCPKHFSFHGKIGGTWISRGGTS